KIRFELLLSFSLGGGNSISSPSISSSLPSRSGNCSNSSHVSNVLVVAPISIMITDEDGASARGAEAAARRGTGSRTPRRYRSAHRRKWRVRTPIWTMLRRRCDPGDRLRRGQLKPNPRGRPCGSRRKDEPHLRYAHRSLPDCTSDPLCGLVSERAFP